MGTRLPLLRCRRADSGFIVRMNQSFDAVCRSPLHTSLSRQTCYYQQKRMHKRGDNDVVYGLPNPLDADAQCKL